MNTGASETAVGIGATFEKDLDMSTGASGTAGAIDAKFEKDLLDLAGGGNSLFSGGTDAPMGGRNQWWHEPLRFSAERRDQLRAV